MLQLITDGLKLCPTSPTFIDLRDAILQADLVNNSGANQCILWEGFAERGLGYSATTPGSGSLVATDGFDVSPLACISSEGVVVLDAQAADGLAQVADGGLRLGEGHSRHRGTRRPRSTMGAAPEAGLDRGRSVSRTS